ncbi:unnamed protein product [Gordionus sp. m RMFG-2023]
MSMFPALLKNKSKSIIKETAWTLSNIAAGNKDQIEQIFNMQLVQPMIDIMNKGSGFICQREAAWVIANIGISGHNEFLFKLIEMKESLMPAISSFFTLNNDPKLVYALLQTTSFMLKASEGINKLEELLITIESCEGLDKLEQLQSHPNKSVYEISCQIIENYFGVEEEEDDLNQADKTEFCFDIPSTSYQIPSSNSTQPGFLF